MNIIQHTVNIQSFSGEASHSCLSMKNGKYADSAHLPEVQKEKLKNVKKIGKLFLVCEK